MKVRSMVAGLVLLALTAGTASAQRARQGTNVAPPLEKILASAERPDSAQLADLVEIKPELPLGPADVLKEYAQAMTLIAQVMTAEVATISRAQDANQITREQAEYLIEQRYQIAMMQYQVLSALHDTLERDISQQSTRSRRPTGGTSPDTAVVVPLPSSAPSAETK